MSIAQFVQAKDETSKVFLFQTAQQEGETRLCWITGTLDWIACWMSKQPSKSVSYKVHCFHGKLCEEVKLCPSCPSGFFSLGGSDKIIHLIISEDRCSLSSTKLKGANQIVTLITTE